MIFQEMSLVPTLTAAQNIFLNNEIKDALGLHRRQGRGAARPRTVRGRSASTSIRTRSSGDLSAGQRQLTEIVKAISRNVRVLILDEPTTALSGGEVEKLFTFLRRLKSRGRRDHLCLAPHGRDHADRGSRDDFARRSSRRHRADERADA